MRSLEGDSTVPAPLDLTSSEVMLSRDHDPLHLLAEHRSGEVVRIEHGAYLSVHRLRELEGWRRSTTVLRARCVADAARLSPQTVFSHVTAAALLGLWVPPRIEVVHVTQTFKTKSQRDTIVRHHRPLSDDDITQIDGVLVTGLTRTVIDCITSLPVEWALAVADSAMRLRLPPRRRDQPHDRDEVEALREEWVRYLAQLGPMRGCRQARDILRRADPGSESPGESRLRCVALAAGLPAPILQMPVRTAEGLFHADFGWALGPPHDRTFACVEFDGRGKYEDPSEQSREEARQSAIIAAGHRLERFSGEDLLNEVRHLILPRLFALVPELVEAREPVVHLNPRPPRRRNRRL